jgi:long-chain fatty acid transport protein
VREWLSVGGSVTAGYAALDQKANVNNLLAGQEDGKLHFEDHDFGVGGTVGLLLQPLDGTRIAVTYRPPLDFDLDDLVDFENVLPPLSTAIGALGIGALDVKVDLEMPQQVLIGLQQRLADGLDLVVNADWEQWSRIGVAEISVVSDAVTTVSAEVPSEDTWHVAVGLRWRPREKWLFTTGFGWDSSMFTTSNRSPTFPIDRQIRVGAGVEHDLRDDLALGFSYEYMNGGKASIQRTGGALQGSLFGDFDRNEIHFFTVSVSLRP